MTPSAGGDADLCVYRGPDPASDLVRCSTSGPGVTDEVFVRKQDLPGDDSITVYVRVFWWAGAVNYTLTVQGNVTTSISPNL
jgi:hypothetical protein